MRYHQPVQAVPGTAADDADLARSPFPSLKGNGAEQATGVQEQGEPEQIAEQARPEPRIERVAASR